MKEVLYTISGKRLPIVFPHRRAALTSHSLNVHCGHDDVMSCFGLRLGDFVRPQCAGSLRPCRHSRRAAEAVETPFMNVQDGFLTTHTIENIKLPELEFLKNSSAIRIKSSAACLTQ
jgi:pyruvate-ferredoxin/flavodoxin oxidoreductase